MSALKHSAKKSLGLRKHVEKVSSGEIFGSVTEAAKAAGVDVPAMSNHLNGRRKHIHGETYRFTGETSSIEYGPSHGNPDIGKLDNRKRVVKLSTGEVFDSVNDASSHAGVDKGTMSKHLNGHRRHIHGETYHFEGQAPKVDVTQPISRLRKPVLNVSTGEVFDSLNEAAQYAGVHKTVMSKCVNGKLKHVRGDLYMFLSE